MRKELIGTGTAVFVTATLLSGCSEVPHPHDTEGVSASAHPEAVKRIELSGGVLDLGNAAVRRTIDNTLATLPSAVAAEQDAVVPVTSQYDIHNQANGLRSFRQSAGTGFKVMVNNRPMIITAGHVLKGELPGDERNCGDTHINVGSANSTIDPSDVPITNAYGSFDPFGYRAPDIEALIVAPATSLDHSPSIPLRRTETAIPSGTVVYSTNYQPLDENTPRNPSSYEPSAQKPNTFAGIVLGPYLNSPSQYVIATGLKSYDNTQDEGKKGSSGAPFMLSNGQAVGLVSRGSLEGGITPEAFKHRLGYTILGEQGINYTIMQTITEGDVTEMQSKLEACQPTP